MKRSPIGKRAKSDWVVVGGKNGELGHCTRCGMGLSLGLPQSLGVVGAAMKAFAKNHASCQPGQYAEPDIQTVEEWLTSRDTGLSSMTIYHVMRGSTDPHAGSIPYDSGDFGRCYRLLKLIPLWRERLSEVGDKYPRWKPLVENWDELTALYEQELSDDYSPKLYKRLRELEQR